MIHWYLQAAVFPDGDNLHRLGYLIEEMGMAVHVEPYIPFGGMRYDFLPEDQPVICYGSVAMLRHALTQLRQRPGAFCDWGLLRCSSYYARYGEHLLQRRYGMYPFAEVVRLQPFLYDSFAADGCVFIRPDDNDKSFAGEVIHHGAFPRWLATVAQDPPPPEQLCVVSRPEVLLAEWRLVIAGGQVVTGSQYRRAGSLELERGCPAEVARFAEQLAARWTPHPVFVMDVALCDDGYRLIEIGSVNCAGLYRCDLRAVVAALRDAVAAL